MGEQLPIPIVLHCPECGLQHVDAPDEQCEHTLQLYCSARCVLAKGHDGEHLTSSDDIPESRERWTNPPHKSHKCHGCGTIWRPADVPTNGVATIETRGERDTWLPSASQPARP